MKIKNKTIKVIIGVIVAIAFFVALMLALPWMLRVASYLLRLFMPFVLSYGFALIVDPIVRKMQKRIKMPRNITALAVIVILLGVVGGGVTFAIYKIVSEFKALVNNLPLIHENLLLEIETIKSSLWGLYEILPANIQQALAETTNQFTNGLASVINIKSVPFVTGAGVFAKSLPKVFVSLIVFILATFFMISDLERVKSIVKKPFSDKMRDRFTAIADQIRRYLGGYIKAQGTIMLVVFCILFIGLSLLRVDFALLIALGTAFLDALPFFGSGAVLWPWTIVNFISGDVRMGIATIVMYVVILVVRQLIEPKIVSKNIGTNPLLTLISMYLGFRLFSVGGMILGPVVMLLIISLYRAGAFDRLIEFAKFFAAYINNHWNGLKTKIKEFWESE